MTANAGEQEDADWIAELADAEEWSLVSSGFNPDGTLDPDLRIALVPLEVERAADA